MNIDVRLRESLLPHKRELMQNGFKNFLGRLYEGGLTFEECIKFSNELSNLGLHKINSSMLKEIVSQKSFDYFELAKQGDISQDDLYKINLKKPMSKKSSIHSKRFFESGEGIQENYNVAWNKLADSLTKEKKYVEALGAYKIYKVETKGKGEHINELESILREDRFLRKNTLYQKGAPETSYVIRSHKELKDIKNTFNSIVSGTKGVKKEIIILVDNDKQLNQLEGEKEFREHIISIEGESDIGKTFAKKEDSEVNIRLVKVGDKKGKYASFNLGATKAISSSPEYLSFFESGDVLQKGGHGALKSKLGENKGMSIGDFVYLGKDKKIVDSLHKRWKDYLRETYKEGITLEKDKYTLFEFSNHLIKRKNLEEMLIDDNFVFDPRLEEHTAEHEFFNRFVEKYSDESINYTNQVVLGKNNGVNLKTDGEKKNIVFVSTTMENTHGVPVVMNNIAENLSKEKYNVFYLINDFNTKKIKLYDSSRENFIEASNREELIEIAKTYNPKFLEGIDILHTHTWHLADDFKHFHTRKKDLSGHEEDPMKIKDFLGEFSNAKVVFTDHSNPSEDLANINEYYNLQGGYEALNASEKKAFIEKNKVDTLKDDWSKKWAFTSMKGKKQLSDLADVVVNVSNSQHAEGKEMIPGYSPKERQTIYNGIDMVEFSKDTDLNQEVEMLSKEVKNRYHLDKKENIILYSGRLSKRKGIYDLAKALKRLDEKTGKENKLVIMGAADQRVRDKLKELSQSNKIVYTGRINDRKEIAALYRAADVTVQPTHGECFNQVIGESLSQGTPVVATDVSGPKEVYVDKGWAYGVQRGENYKENIENLTNAISNVLSNKELEKIKVLTQIKPKIESELGLRKMVGEYSKLYEKLAA